MAYCYCILLLHIAIAYCFCLLLWPVAIACCYGLLILPIAYWCCLLMLLVATNVIGWNTSGTDETDEAVKRMKR